jgi:hypothetical protein
MTDCKNLAEHIRRRYAYQTFLVTTYGMVCCSRTACVNLKRAEFFLFRMLLVLPLLMLTVASTIAIAAPAQSIRISQYQPFFKPFYNENGALLVAIRRYNHGDDRRALVLDPQRFELGEMEADKVLSARPAKEEAWRDSPFARALFRQTSPPYALQNDGLQEAEHSVKGFFLTADLCPSKKPLDRTFFEATGALPQKRPVPIALMVSGLWIERHEADLSWLKEQINTGRLTFTWVNHSYTHPYIPGAPLEKNFLLAQKVNFADEVLRTERQMLELGLPPSPFFRFPGLVSDQRLIGELRDLCLIPIGSNAWLAKGESPKTGSVVLVHANGNEPEGIHLLRSFYDRQKDALSRGDVALLPLREAFLLP